MDITWEPVRSVNSDTLFQQIENCGSRTQRPTFGRTILAHDQVKELQFHYFHVDLRRGWPLEQGQGWSLGYNQAPLRLYFHKTPHTYLIRPHPSPTGPS